MSDQARRDYWDPFALLLCQTANINRDSMQKVSPYEVSDFHPYMQKKRIVKKIPQKEVFAVMKKVFCS